MSILTNLKQILFFKSLINGVHLKTRAFDLLDAETDGKINGLKCLYLFLNKRDDSMNGYSIPLLDYTSLKSSRRDSVSISSYLGHGATSECFGTSEPHNFVLKKLHEREAYDRELFILRKIGQTAYLSQLIGYDDIRMCIVMSPRGLPLSSQHFSYVEAEQMFCCLEALMKFKIVHRDIASRHFLWHKVNHAKR